MRPGGLRTSKSEARTAAWARVRECHPSRQTDCFVSGNGGKLVGGMHRSALAPVVMTAMTSLVLSGCGGEKVTMRSFSGGWQAHARALSITRAGHGREWLSLGKSSPLPRQNFVFDGRFRLSRPQGTPHDATARATITAVRIGGQSAFTAAHRAPRVGESFRIRLHNGVLTSQLSGSNYCGPGVNWPKAGCGM